MAGYVMVGALAVLGLLWSVWMVAAVIPAVVQDSWLLLNPGDRILWKRCLHLREMGLLICRLAVWEEALTPQERAWLEGKNVEIWTTAQIRARFEIGAKEHGAGTGNSPGCHQCGGVPEL